MMERQIKEAFDAVHADPLMLAESERAILQKMRQGARLTRVRTRRLLPLVAVLMCVLAAVGLGGYHVYYTPTTVVSIDINPSFEMDINRFDRVIGVNGYNEDGRAVAQELDVQNMNYDDALDAIMANSTITKCLAGGEELSIAVVQADDGDAEQSQAVLDYASSCTAHHNNAHCYALESTNTQMADAHDAGLSCGKYHIYQALLAYDPSLTTAEVQQMTMRQLRNLLAQYEGGAETTSVDSQAASQAGSSSQGHGYGQARANGQGASSGAGSGSGQGQGSGTTGGWGQGNGSAARYGSGHSAHHGSGHE